MSLIEELEEQIAFYKRYEPKLFRNLLLVQPSLNKKVETVHKDYQKIEAVQKYLLFNHAKRICKPYSAFHKAWDFKVLEEIDSVGKTFGVETRNVTDLLSQRHSFRRITHEDRLDELVLSTWKPWPIIIKNPFTRIVSELEIKASKYKEDNEHIIPLFEQWYGMPQTTHLNELQSNRDLAGK